MAGVRGVRYGWRGGGVAVLGGDGCWVWLVGEASWPVVGVVGCCGREEAMGCVAEVGPRWQGCRTDGRTFA